MHTNKKNRGAQHSGEGLMWEPHRNIIQIINEDLCACVQGNVLLGSTQYGIICHQNGESLTHIVSSFIKIWKNKCF